MITLDRLRYFEKAAELQHVGRAAKSLHVSPSVVSAAILSLESEIGCDLFRREGKRLWLNERGESLQAEAQKILQSIEGLSEKISGEPPPLKGHIRTAATPFLLESYLAPVILDMIKENPEITADLKSIDTGTAVHKVLLGELDFALVIRTIKPAGVDCTDLYGGDFHIAVSIDSPVLTATKMKKIQILNSISALTFKPQYGPNFVEDHPVFKEFGVIPKQTISYDNNLAALKVLTSLDSWALLPDQFIQEQAHLISKVPMGQKWSAPYHISLISKAGRQNSRALEAVHDKLEQRFKSSHN